MEQLVKVAKELNKILGLAPAIEVKKTTETVLTDAIIEAAAYLEVDDDVSKESQKVLKKLGVWPPAPKEEEEDQDVPEEEEEDEEELEDGDDEEEEEVGDEEEEEEEEPEPEPAPKAKGKKGTPMPAPEPEPEEDEEDDEEVGPDFSDLIAQVKKANKLPVADRNKALKKIAKDNEIFSNLSKKLVGSFNSDDIKDQMLEILVKAENKAVVGKGPKGSLVSEKPAKESAKTEKPSKAEKKSAKTEKPSKEKASKPAKKEGARTKKAVIEAMIATKTGATIEQMAKQMVDEGIDADFDKNKTVTKLWLSKMGFDTKAASIAANPYFKK